MLTTIARTILEQLGGLNRLTVMIGVKHAVARPDGVGIRFKARANKRINHIEITLDPSDTYTVEFWFIPRILTAEPVAIASYTDVNAENLRQVIEFKTGLRLNL